MIKWTIRFAVIPLLLSLQACTALTVGSAVVSVAGTTVSIAGTAVSLGVSAGKAVVGTTVDVVEAISNSDESCGQ